MEIKDLAGNVIWKYDSEAEKANFKQTDPYTLEHVNWINCIRGGKQIEQASETAISNMAAIMGRESAYTGAETTWDAMTASALDYTPKDLNLGKMDMSGFVDGVIKYARVQVDARAVGQQLALALGDICF